MSVSASSAKSAKDVIVSLIGALNREDFATARKYVGVLGSRQGAEAYFKDMEHMRLKYNIQKAFVEGDDVCLIYDLKISGMTIFSCGLYHVRNGQVDSLEVLFRSPTTARGHPPINTYGSVGTEAQLFLDVRV